MYCIIGFNNDLLIGNAGSHPKAKSRQVDRVHKGGPIHNEAAKL